MGDPYVMCARPLKGIMGPTVMILSFTHLFRYFGLFALNLTMDSHNGAKKSGTGNSKRVKQNSFIYFNGSVDFSQVFIHSERKRTSITLNCPLRPGLIILQRQHKVDSHLSHLRLRFPHLYFVLAASLCRWNFLSSLYK